MSGPENGTMEVYRRKAPPFTNSAAFITGFELARRSLFKMLREGAPDNRDKLAVASK